MSRTFLFACFLIPSFLLLPAMASSKAADPDEPHLLDPSARLLYTQSVFIHGYLHGYEEGFHNADIDIQMGHGFRDVNILDAYKKVTCYRADFGNRRVFERGYRQGFRVGYTDGMSERSFRAIQLLRRAATGLDLIMISSQQQSTFDLGVQDGYHAGQTEGLHDGRSAQSFRHAAPGCATFDKNGHFEKEPEYCEGFNRAFVIGYSDGYTNQQDNPHVAVK